MSDTVLKCEHLRVVFGGLAPVSDFDIEVKKNEIAGLIGPNGAGKTTVFNLLTGVYVPTKGKVILEGQDLDGMSTIQRSHAGIARTFQNIRLFKGVSVLDNVLIGYNQSMHYGLVPSILRLPNYWKEEKRAKEKALELLSVFDMQGMANVNAGNLPYGAQRRLEIVRALATNPKLLLLDEPAAGMNPAETTALMETIRKIRDTFNIAILLIEHDMNLVMGICENITVLNFGEVIARGTPSEIQNNPVVIEAYLGKKRN
ncbi:MAG: ABC transporter ATP-binding protein [Sphaerochaetaceae bacterium]|nr:ABC transporter ATP-binding protein [Sphaerochaetaceae bacterium]